MIDSLLLAAAPVATFQADQALTRASGFFFRRDGRLFLVTSRHVMIDEPSQHVPDRLEVELHTNPENVVETITLSVPLYREGKAAWRQGVDSSGGIDVAAIELERADLPERLALQPFTPDHLAGPREPVEIGSSVLILGFPMGFYDPLHRLPVVRQAVVASAFGLRFQGEGYFLTDGRTHRGSSGAPVIQRIPDPGPTCRALPWRLLGVHAARLDVGPREPQQDEALGLNCAWYADILTTLTEG